MSEDIKLDGGLFLRIRVMNHDDAEERAREAAETVDGAEMKRQKYKEVYNSFRGVDSVCEVCHGDPKDPKVIGVLPTLQGFKLGMNATDITTDIELTFLCFQNPLANKGEIIVR